MTPVGVGFTARDFPLFVSRAANAYLAAADKMSRAVSAMRLGEERPLGQKRSLPCARSGA